MTGWLAIAGLGPGRDDLVTPEVSAALAEATDVVGYIPYVARVAPRPGLVLHPSDNRVELDRARYNLSVTRVIAPADGVIYQASSFHEGVMLAAGQAVFALVETGDAWVDANFKETQLADLAQGQPAEIVFDAAPGKTFTGKVEAIGAGTGAEFSLLPAQNATGNWVKVTQRVPVRIVIESKSPRPLIAGLSVNVTVHTGGKDH